MWRINVTTLMQDNKNGRNISFWLFYLSMSNKKRNFASNYKQDIHINPI